MTTISREIREAVAERAGHRYEYCCLPDRLQAGGFELDHVLPAARGGLPVSENLAYACPHCNDRKKSPCRCPGKPESTTGGTNRGARRQTGIRGEVQTASLDQR